jgi:hypothetical protein
MNTTKPLRLKWRWSDTWKTWTVSIAECEVVVSQLSDGWYVQIDLNVLRTERTTIEHGPCESAVDAQQWAENRFMLHAKREAQRMQMILKEFGVSK